MDKKTFNSLEQKYWKRLLKRVVIFILENMVSFYSWQEVDKNYQVNQIKFYGVKVVTTKYL